MVLLIIIILLHSSIILSNAYISIDDFGAVRDDSASTATNSQSLLTAIVKASTASGNDRIVYIPAYTYYFNAVHIDGYNSITIHIDGYVIITNDPTNWPTDSAGYWSETPFMISVLYFTSCNDITIRGKGSIDAQGWRWWNTVMTTGVDDRPKSIIDMRESYGVLIEGITLLNSPQYYMWLYDMKDIVIQDIIIDTNPRSPSNELTFPINTDGIDIMAENVTVRDVHIQNYDDMIAVKPCRNYFKYCTCSSNIHVSGITSYHGVGLSIGSVSPTPEHNCVRNVVITDVKMIRPFKGVYVKTNPGDTGTAEITNVTFSNIKMEYALWWPIYIGPQQQKQPGQSSAGCMFYPVDTQCSTQPLTKIADIYMSNILATNSITYFNSPGIIRCDVNAPCTNIHMSNVRIYQSQVTKKYAYSVFEMLILRQLGDTTSDYFWRYIVENVHGSSACNDPPLQLTYPLPGVDNASSLMNGLVSNTDIQVVEMSASICSVYATKTKSIFTRLRVIGIALVSTLAFILFIALVVGACLVARPDDDFRPITFKNRVK